MKRVIARPPENLAEICLLRLGLQARGLSALLYAIKVAKAVDRSAADAIRNRAGLLRSERCTFRLGHYGVLQYWESFDALEAWSHRPPHSEWWAESVQRMRTKGDFGIYHESYVVPRERIEAIALDCFEPVGLFAFGQTGEAVGADTNSRGRLRLGQPSGRPKV